MTSPYRPFIDDPNDIARFEGLRFAVLRATESVQDVHHHVRLLIQEQLAGSHVSYPADGHVTLAGFPRGAPLDVIRDLVAEWVPSVAPLRLEVEKAGCFPAPHQVVMVQIRKTTELCEALTSLRARAAQRELGESELVAAADWIFHMSVAYCAHLDVPAWAAVTRFVDGLSVPAAQCVVGAVEIVAFDDHREYSGGVFELSAPAVRR
jgi:2'-5' RNA ligase